MWDGEIQDAAGGEIEGFQHSRWIFEDRSQTTFKLIDNCPGFGPGARKPVISWQKSAVAQGLPFNNLEAKNTIRGAKIDIGAGNPGAIGVWFTGANAQEAGELTIISSDPNKAGYAGWFNVGCAQVWLHDITVDGFDYGIDGEHLRVTQCALEHATLRNQRKAAIHGKQNAYTIRGLRSENAVPAIQMDDDAAAVQIVDSELVGGAAGVAAMNFQQNGLFFARNVQTAGYGAAIRRGSTNVVVGPNVTEYKTAGFSLFGAVPPTSIPVPVQDVPIMAWPAVGDWAVVTTGTKAAVQAALNSGKPGVMFKPSQLLNIGTVDVPASVKRINLSYAGVDAVFRLAADSTVPLLIEDGFGCDVVQNGKNRTVIITHTAFQEVAGSVRYINATPKTTDKVFLNGMSSMANGPGNLFTLGKMQVWGRMINHEPKNLSPADVACFNWEAGARVWIFGGKTETNSNAIRAIGGSRLEVLGFMANQTYFLNTDRTSSVIVYVTDSRVSVSLHSDQIPNRTVGYRNTVKAIDGAVTKQLSFAATPKRPDEAYAVFLPLYVDNI